MARINKTKLTLDIELTINRNYAKIAKSTNISSKRLSEIKAGKGAKPSRQEIGKISSYGRKDKPISLRILSRISGFSEKDIQGRMRYEKRKKTTGNVGQFKTDMTVTNLTYHTNGTITGKRLNGQKVIYYIFIGEDTQTGEINVGHGFRAYITWIEQGKPDFKEEKHYGNSGDLYYITTMYFNLLSKTGIGLPEFIRSHAYKKETPETSFVNRSKAQQTRRKKEKEK